MLFFFFFVFFFVLFFFLFLLVVALLLVLLLLLPLRVVAGYFLFAAFGPDFAQSKMMLGSFAQGSSR